MEECKWKDGSFKPCSDFNGVVLKTPPAPGMSVMRYFCEVCGRDIMKPEPVIKISGETFVCRFKGVDYLCVDPISCNGKARSLEMEFSKMPHIWQQIEGLEITDEIAKLRPVTILDDHNSDNARYRSHILYAVSETEFFTDLCHAAYKPDVPLRLATVSDLEDNSEKP